MKLIGCTGCGICEAVCGYHHTGTFCPTKSSILVHYGGDDYDVKVYFDTPPDGHTTCERCVEPLCTKYCPKREALRALLDLDEGGRNT